MAKAYAYIRYSRIEQQGGDSENRQFNALERFTAATSVAVEEVIYDRGKSAFRGDNARSGNFKDVLERIAKKTIRKDDFLVVESIDRITRQRVLDGVELLQSILKKGIKIYTTTDEKIYSYSEPSRDFETLVMIALIAQRANEESETKSKRLKASWNKRREKAQNGEVIIKSGSGVPFGLRVVDNRFEIIEEERQEIERLFNLLIEMGVNTAIAKLNETSLKRWNNGTLNKILKAKTVIGCMPICKVEHNSETGKSRKVVTGFIDNYYPKLIEPSLFFRAIDAMERRKIKGWSGNKSEQDFNIFKHQIYCQGCGGKMYYDHRGSRYKDKIYPFFKCDNARVQKHICNAENVRFEYVLCCFLRCIKSIKRLANDGSMKNTSWGRNTRAFDNSLSSILQIEDNSDEELKSKISELSACRLKIDNMNAQFKELEGNAPLQFLKLLSKLETQYDDLKIEIEKLESKSNSDLQIKDETTVIELFQTESGRLRLNRFFKDNDLAFFVGHDKAQTKTTFEVRRKNENVDEIISSNMKFFEDKKQPLKEFGLIDLQTMFDLSVN